MPGNICFYAKNPLFLFVILSCCFVLVHSGISLEVLEESLKKFTLPEGKVPTDAPSVKGHYVVPYGPLSMFNAYFLDKYNALLMKRLWSEKIKMGYTSKDNTLVFDHGKDRGVGKKSFDSMLVKLFSCINNQFAMRGNDEGFQKNFDRLDFKIQAKLLAVMFVGSLDGNIFTLVQTESYEHLDPTSVEEENKNTLQIQFGNDQSLLIESSSLEFLGIIKWFLDPKSGSDMALFEGKPDFVSLEDYLENDAGKFDQYTCSKNILLQGIFSFYMSTPEEMRRFLGEVYALLSIHSDKSSPKHNLFKMCYQPLGRIKSQINAAFKFTAEYDNIRTKSFPVSKVNQPQSNHSVPFFKRNPHPGITFPNGEYKTGTYPDCVEVSILYFMSCLLFDMERYKFSTEYLKQDAYDLVKFFQKYPQVFTINSPIRKDWCAVIADLTEPEIEYVKDSGIENNCPGRNELETGLLNYLRVICSICGLNSLFEESAVGLLSADPEANSPQVKGEKWEQTLIGEEFDLLLKNILRAAMGEKRAGTVEITYSEMIVNSHVMKNDIFGDVHLKFQFSECESITVCLSHSAGHAQIYLENDSYSGEDSMEFHALEENIIQKSTFWTPALFIGAKLVEISTEQVKVFDKLEKIEELSTKINKNISHLYDPSLLEHKVPVLIALKMITEKRKLKDMKYHAIAENIILSSNLTDDHFIKLSFLLFSMFKVRDELGGFYNGIVNPKYLVAVLLAIKNTRILHSYLISNPKQKAFLLGTGYEMSFCSFLTSSAYWNPPLMKTGHPKNTALVLENFPAELLNDSFLLKYYLPPNFVATWVDSCDKKEGLDLYKKLKYHKNATAFFCTISDDSENGGILRFLSIEEFDEWFFQLLEMDDSSDIPDVGFTFGYFMKALFLKDEVHFTKIVERIKSVLLPKSMFVQECFWSSLGASFMSKISTENFLKLTKMMLEILYKKLETLDLQGSDGEIRFISNILEKYIFEAKLPCPTKTLLEIMIKMKECPQISDAISRTGACCRLYEFLFIENSREIGLMACRAVMVELCTDAILELPDLKSKLDIKIAALKSSQ